MSDLYIPKPYPKAIYKDGDVKIVQNPYEHAKMCDEGWSGPPEFGADLPALEALVVKTQGELAEMEKRLAEMKRQVEKYAPPPPPEEPPVEPVVVKKDAVPEPVDPKKMKR